MTGHHLAVEELPGAALALLAVAADIHRRVAGQRPQWVVFSSAHHDAVYLRELREELVQSAARIACTWGRSMQ